MSQNLSGLSEYNKTRLDMFFHEKKLYLQAFINDSHSVIEWHYEQTNGLWQISWLSECL